MKTQKQSSKKQSSAAAKKTVRSKNNAAELKAARSKNNAFHTAQPGIIGYIMSMLIAARDAQQPLTANSLLEKLSKKFPERPVSGMFVTVRAQLSRLPFEREFAIDKVRDGKYVTYAAAKGAKIPLK